MAPAKTQALLPSLSRSTTRELKLYVAVFPIETYIYECHPQLPHIINAAVLLSAWSAAASDVYISSRFLFFLARCHHAPQFLASLVRYPSTPRREHLESEEELSDEETEEEDVPPVIHITRETEAVQGESPRQNSAELSQPFLSFTPLFESPSFSAYSLSPEPVDSDKEKDVHVSIHEASSQASEDPIHYEDTFEVSERADAEVGETIREKEPLFVLPLNAVLVSASVGLLSFLGSVSGNTAVTVSRVFLVE